VERTAGIVLSVLVMAWSLGTPAFSANEGTSLRPGDYAVYIIPSASESCASGTMLYPPFYGIENQIFIKACPVTLRWDVLAVSDGLSEIRIMMQGWRSDPRNLSVTDIHDPQDPIFNRIVSTLHIPHTIRVDLATMDAWREDGTYLGRWSFHLTPAEVASGNGELARNWYNGTPVPAEVAVTNDLIRDYEENVAELFGVDTFVTARVPPETPFPGGLERYVYELGGGWQQLPFAMPLYEPVSLPMLACYCEAYYSDILFNLYGIIWLGDFARTIPERPSFPSTITLVETNIIKLPGSEPPGDGGGDGGDGGGGDGGGGDAGGGDTSGGGGSSWPTVLMFSAVALVASVIAYRWLARVRGHHRQQSQSRSRESHQAERSRKP